MKKIFTFLMVLLTAANFSALAYQSPISVEDGSLADWDNLPAEYVFTTTHTEGASMDALKSVKVYATEDEINLWVEWDTDIITDLSVVPFHIYFNVDGDAETGGGWTADFFLEPNNTDFFLEGLFYADGAACAYEPGIWAYGGEYNTNDWDYSELNAAGTFAFSQHIGNNMMEIKLLYELIPANWTDEFSIGFDIQQSWYSVGILPNAADDEIGNFVKAEKLNVKIDHSAYVGYRTEIDGLTYEITDLESPTAAVVDCQESLTTVNIPSSVTIKDVSYSVTSIGREAFAYCYSLTSITIPNSVTEIGSWAFESCSSLTSITIPNSVIEIGDGAFSGCSSLMTPVYNAHLFAYMPRSYKGAYIIPDGIKQISKEAFASCHDLTSVTIPNSVTKIGSWAFFNCSSLTSVTIPNSVTSIGYEVFSSCISLTYLSIPNSVSCNYESIYNIYNCPKLKTLIAPADFFSIYEAYYQEIIVEVFPYLPEQLESLEINAGELPRLGWDFIERNHKTLKTINLAATTNASIAEKAFYDCYSLNNLSLPSLLEYIPYMAVADCKYLKSITIPTTVEKIGDGAFENCRLLSEINFAEDSTLTEIGNWAFYNCHELKNVVIPEGVTHVGYAAFYGCTYLEEMTLPSTMKEVGDNGFGLCAKMKKMHVNANTPPTIQAKTFEDVDRSIPVYVPTEAVETYKADPYWSEFNIQSEDNGLESITNNASSSMKILYNGQLLIIRDGKTYTVMGTEVK